MPSWHQFSASPADSEIDIPPPQRLLFTAQLQHEIQSLSRDRELSILSPGGGSQKRFSVGNFDQIRSISLPSKQCGQSKNMEINGWDLEKKIAALTELQPLLKQPYFFYDDWGNYGKKRKIATFLSPCMNVQAKVANSSNAGDSFSNHGSPRQKTFGSAFENYNFFFHNEKCLSLSAGQHALLNLWEYLLDMIEVMSSLNRTRILYFQLSTYICRRVEFIQEYHLHDQEEKIAIDTQVMEKYHILLLRSLRIAAAEFRHSSAHTVDYAKIISQIYASAYLRFPYAASAIEDGIIMGMEHVERSDIHHRRRRANSGKGHVDNAAGKLFFPQSDYHARNHASQWHTLILGSRDMKMCECKQLVLEQFLEFKQAHKDFGENLKQSDEQKAPGSSGLIYSDMHLSLEAAFQQGLDTLDDIDCLEFISSVPLLYCANITQSWLFNDQVLSRDDLDKVLLPFLTSIRQPNLDNLLIVPFAAAILRTLKFWRESFYGIHRGMEQAEEEHLMVWHCIPGYFVIIRAVFLIFRQLCRRRPRKPSNLLSVVRIKSPVSSSNMTDTLPDSTFTEPWAAYWPSRIVFSLVHELIEIFRNGWLINPFLQVVLEGTNIFDTTSVNYSFTVLQLLLTTAAHACPKTGRRQLWSSDHDLVRGVVPRFTTSVASTFDSLYFIHALRIALQSMHIEILLKALTLLANVTGLLPSTDRQRLIGDLLIRENFFQLFLHWNEEVQKAYNHILVYRLASSNRLALPCSSDKILLAHTPFFTKQEPFIESTSGMAIWTQVSDFAHSIFRGSSLSDEEDQKGRGAKALQRLLEWKSGLRLRADRSEANAAIFRESLIDEELSVDLSLVSKLDAIFKMLGDQLGRKVEQQHFPQHLEIYAEKALAHYVQLLKAYYVAALERPQTVPIPPTLDFNVSLSSA